MASPSTSRARLLTGGKISTVDGGRCEGADGASRPFVQAAAVGIQVAFARRATTTSRRRRFGQLTYLVAAALARRTHRPIICELRVNGRRLRLHLLHLTVINAPVVGGIFGLRVPGSSVDDRRLDVLAVEEMPLSRLLVVAALLMLRTRPLIGGVPIYHARRLEVRTARPRDVSLDGEVAGQVPGAFTLVADALRLVTPRAFAAADDAPLA